MDATVLLHLVDFKLKPLHNLFSFLQIIGIIGKREVKIRSPNFLGMRDRNQHTQSQNVVGTKEKVFTTHKQNKHWRVPSVHRQIKLQDNKKKGKSKK